MVTDKDFDSEGSKNCSAARKSFPSDAVNSGTRSELTPTQSRKQVVCVKIRTQSQRRGFCFPGNLHIEAL